MPGPATGTCKREPVHSIAVRMTLRARQRERIERTIAWAKKTESVLAAVRERHLGEVHFRPGSTGVSMVGLRPERPQRGRSGITNLERLAQDFERQFHEACVECEQGRATPEKLLQSDLVAQAYRDERRLSMLAGGQDAPVFVADELSLPTSGGRIVCDLLALHAGSPVVIELKSAREMKRLIEQVTTYAALVEEHIDLFEELYATILGRSISLRGPCQRWIVWPAAKGHDRDPREDQLAELGIRVVGYQTSPQGFVFQVGRALASS